MIDDNPRVAYAEIHGDEKVETAVGVLLRAVSWFADRGVTVERVLSDNGSAYTSYLWRDTCAELGIKAKKTPLSATDQREDRTLPPRPRRRLGILPPLQQRVSPPSSTPRLAPRIQSPPAPHRHRKQTTNHPVNQPAWAVQLERLGLPAVRWHDLRHFYASACAAAGIDIRKVSRWMGHDSVNTTDSIYTHLFNGDHETDMDKLGEVAARPVTASIPRIG